MSIQSDGRFDGRPGPMRTVVYRRYGSPYVIRATNGLRRPRTIRPGTDLAGRVEAIGRSVTGIRPGDEVFGSSRGSFAEAVCASADKVAPKPTGLSFEQAAALPVAGITALQGLHDKGAIRSLSACRRVVHRDRPRQRGPAASASVPSPASGTSS